ncbi:MAG: hypothetical protein QJR09_05200 [Micrococcus sp.]|nr:hypothetical protein [Micrococcus sp.]
MPTTKPNFTLDGIWDLPVARTYQRHLQHYGHYPSWALIDGVFGKESLKAVQRQMAAGNRYHGLIDGWFGDMSCQSFLDFLHINWGVSQNRYDDPTLWTLYAQAGVGMYYTPWGSREGYMEPYVKELTRCLQLGLNRYGWYSY